jgi:uncharacterized membrane protein YqjE
MTMDRSPERPLFADLRDEIVALGAEVREMAQARWELARLELQADLRAAKRLAMAWLLSAVLALTALPLGVACLADLLDGRAGIHRYGWLLIFAAGLIVLALAGGYLAWRRFWRKFTGLRETIEELREDLVWMQERAEGGGRRADNDQAVR